VSAAADRRRRPPRCRPPRASDLAAMWRRPLPRHDLDRQRPRPVAVHARRLDRCELLHRVGHLLDIDAGQRGVSAGTSTAARTFSALSRAISLSPAPRTSTSRTLRSGENSATQATPVSPTTRTRPSSGPAQRLERTARRRRTKRSSAEAGLAPDLRITGRLRRRAARAAGEPRR
jgi:hypothetical protein